MIFSKEAREAFKKREEEWLTEIKEAGADEIKSATRSGIALKPAYGPTDLEGLDVNDLFALPGQYPYTRGNYKMHYQVIPPIISQQMSLGDGEQTEKRLAYLKKLGRRMYVGRTEDESFAMITAVDLPTQTGFDADDPEARGKVGECATSMCIMDEMEVAFRGNPDLSNTATCFIGFNSVEVLVAMYAVYCMDIRKETLKNLIIWPVSEHHCQYYYDIAAYPPQAGLKLKVELIKWMRENCPRASSYLVDGYNVAEAGAVPSWEVALAFAEAFATADECVKAGLDPDDFLASFYAHLHLGMHLFEEVAKFRAAKRLWAKLVKEKYGCTNPRALTMYCSISQASGYETVAIEPLNNIIRNTIMCMVGLFSDLDGIHPIAYDEPLGIPSDESLKISTRTLQILVEETDILKVTDPLGGSYYMERLTKEMEEEILKNLKKIDDLGGFIKCYETGWIRAEVARQAYERMKKIASREDVKVGFNKYKVEDSLPPIKVVRRPIELENSVIERVKKFKMERDAEKTKVGLNNLRKAAEAVEKDWPSSAGCLMPSIIEAVRAKATLGECCRVFREVLGYGYYAG